MQGMRNERRRRLSGSIKRRSRSEFGLFGGDRSHRSSRRPTEAADASEAHLGIQKNALRQLGLRAKVRIHSNLNDCASVAESPAVLKLPAWDRGGSLALACKLAGWNRGPRGAARHRRNAFHYS